MPTRWHACKTEGGHRAAKGPSRDEGPAFFGMMETKPRDALNKERAVLGEQSEAERQDGAECKPLGRWINRASPGKAREDAGGRVARDWGSEQSGCDFVRRE